MNSELISLLLPMLTSKLQEATSSQSSENPLSALLPLLLAKLGGGESPTPDLSSLLSLLTKKEAPKAVSVQAKEEQEKTRKGFGLQPICAFANRDVIYLLNRSLSH